MAFDYSYLKVGDGSGDASLMHIDANRSIGATTLSVDTISGVPAKFVGTTGNLLPSGLIDPSTKKDFYGHTSGSDLIIDGFLPGSTDTGNTEGQVVIIKPNTHWANMAAQFIMNATGNGTPEDVTFDDVSATSVSSATVATTGNITEKGNTLTQMRKDMTPDFFVSGGIWTGDAYGSTRAASMTALVCYINGQRGTISAVTARVFTASKDTYIDVLNSSGVFSLVYTEVSNNAASPALAANSLRLGVVVTGASNIAAATSINQGQPSRTVPTTTNLYQSGTDSLGNKINKRNPHSPIVYTAQATLGGIGDTLSLTIPFLEAKNLIVHMDYTGRWDSAAPSVGVRARLNIDGTQVYEAREDMSSNPGYVALPIRWQQEISSGSKIIKCNVTVSAGNVQFSTTTFTIWAYPAGS